ncbi:MAG: hypothetical protein JWO69_527 [Thermoleophilia bacterium]|jgi:hypothetical protein|nr:hypothetical protein [Thermoleophilia bacterium]
MGIESVTGVIRTVVSTVAKGAGDDVAEAATKSGPPKLTDPVGTAVRAADMVGPNATFGRIAARITPADEALLARVIVPMDENVVTPETMASFVKTASDRVKANAHEAVVRLKADATTGRQLREALTRSHDNDPVPTASLKFLEPKPAMPDARPASVQDWEEADHFLEMTALLRGSAADLPQAIATAPKRVQLGSAQRSDTARILDENIARSQAPTAAPVSHVAADATRIPAYQKVQPGAVQRRG